LGTSFGGWPLPVNMIFDQYAFICAGDLPATFVQSSSRAGEPSIWSMGTTWMPLAK
jgi:hypothetical protein